MKFDLLDGKRHDRRRFDCGVGPLNDYLSRYATQDSKRGLNRIYVLAAEERIIGYYSLSAHSVPRDDLPAGSTAGPYAEIPFLLLGRLAVDLAFQRRGYGDALIAHAFRTTRQAAGIVGVAGMIVDAKDDNAMAFYQGFGFVPIAATRNRLMLPITAMNAVL